MVSEAGEHRQSMVDDPDDGPDGPDAVPGARLAAYGAVSTSLALRGDREMRELVDAAAPLGSGIGGRAALLEVSGTPVFVKQVPLTELDLHPDHIRSTANLFGLPLTCQYGIGGPGFGGWREAAVHTMTTNWVLAGQCQGFPLTYHWRVLPDAPPGLPEELADIERVVAFWGGAPEVRRRIEALQRSPASLVLFLEYIPRTLHQWLTDKVRAGDAATADRACSLVEKELRAGVSFMNRRGLLHFDGHFENILTDGRRLYFADYGLALSSRFDLSPAEVEFFERHRTYDRAYTLSYLVNWLMRGLYGYERAEREDLIRACAEGKRPPEGPPGVTATISRYAPLAAVVTDFLGKLQQGSREAVYPLEAIGRTFQHRHSGRGRAPGPAGGERAGPGSGTPPSSVR